MRRASRADRAGGGADRVGQPFHERSGGAQLRAHALVARRLVQPRLEGVATGDSELPAAKVVDPRMVDRVAARGALELGLGGRQTGAPGGGEAAFIADGTAIVVYRSAEALELVGGGLMQ